MTQPLSARQPHALALRNGSRQATSRVIPTTDARGEREDSSASVRVGDRSHPGVASPALQMRFSIVVTSHNQREFIRNAVDSALSVRTADTEVIVVDDASCDGSQEVLRQYGDAIRFASLETNRGASTARNHGASMASGNYLVFLDGDDVLSPWALQVYGRIVQTVKPKLILASMRWFSGALPAVYPQDHPRELQIAEYEDYTQKDRTYGPSASAIVIDRRTFLEVQGWSNDFPVMEDLDLLIRLSDLGPAVQIFSPPTTLYRVHAGNTVNNVPRYIEQMHKLLDKEKVGTYPGGRQRRFARYAVIGGHVSSWVERAAKAGLYRDAMRLAALGWPMVLAAVVRRFSVALRGRRPCENLAL